MAVFILPDFDEGGYYHEEKPISETSLYEAVLTDIDKLASYITSFTPQVASPECPLPLSHHWESIMQDYDELYETVIESSSQFTHHEQGDLSSKMGALKWLIDDYVKRAAEEPYDPDDEEWVEPNW